MIGINILRINLDSYKIPLIYTIYNLLSIRGRGLRLDRQVNTLGKTLKRLIIDQWLTNTCFYETMRDQSVHRIFSL